MSDVPVSARAWCVIRVSDGRRIAGWNDHGPMKVASLVKLMTAAIVAETIETGQATGNELVGFDGRSAGIWGSTASIQTGESLRLSDCLYGLLLPSGNDVALAIAQWYGRRLNPKLADVDPTAPQPDTHQWLAARQQFVSLMNQRAQTVGLHQTRFASPFTDAPDLRQPTSSAEDIAQLARWAAAFRLVDTVASSPSHTATVYRLGRKQRTVTWKNTHRLLHSHPQWCTGLKTGTAQAAGFCLATRISIAGDQWIVVVLGCESDASRYSDTLALREKMLRLANMPALTPPNPSSGATTSPTPAWACAAAGHPGTHGA